MLGLSTEKKLFVKVNGTKKEVKKDPALRFCILFGKNDNPDVEIDTWNMTWKKC